MLTFGACGVTRPCFLPSPALDLLLFLTKNLFRILAVWKSFFAFAEKVPCTVYPGGDPNKWVDVAITTVPMVWVGAVDLIQPVARGGWRMNAVILSRGGSCILNEASGEKIPIVQEKCTLRGRLGVLGSRILCGWAERAGRARRGAHKTN